MALPETQAALLLKKQLRGSITFLLFATHHSFLSYNIIILISFLHFLHICTDLTKSPVDGFSAGLIDESNIFEWQVTVMGPPDTF